MSGQGTNDSKQRGRAQCRERVEKTAGGGRLESLPHRQGQETVDNCKGKTRWKTRMRLAPTVKTLHQGEINHERTGDK